MSRLLAAAGGLTYDLPQDSLARQMAVSPVKSGTTAASGAGRGDNLDPLSKLMEDELYQQEGRTQEYYNKVGALQTFAKQAASAGIDVTRPDYTNPQSIKYHNIYQQAIADIYNTKNDLTRLKSFEDESLKSPNIVRRFDEQGNPFFAQTGQSAFVKQFEEMAKLVQSDPELADFNQKKAIGIKSLQSELANATNPRERQEIQSQIEQLSAIAPGIGISPYQKASLEQDESQFARGEANKFALKKMEIASDKSNKGAEKQKNTWGRVDNIISSSTNRDVTQLATIPGVADAKFEDRLGGTFLTWMDSQGYTREFKIDLKNNDSFKRSLLGMNSLFNSGQGSEGGGDVSNESIIEELNSLTDEELTKLRNYYLEQANFAEDKTDKFREVINEELKIGAPADTFETISTVLNSASYGYIPDSLMKKGKVAGGGWSLNEVKYSPSWALNPFGTDEVIVDLVNEKGEVKSVSLDINNEKDVNILKDLVDENVDILPSDIIDRI